MIENLYICLLTSRVVAEWIGYFSGDPDNSSDRVHEGKLQSTDQE